MPTIRPSIRAGSCNALSEALPENAVISEETTVYRSLIQETIPRDQPQSYFARITGGLGVGLSYALGVKFAMPDRPVFALIGDGAFHYNAVPSCLGVAEEYGLPIHCRGLQQRPLSVDGNQLDQIFSRRRGEKPPAFTTAPRSARGRTTNTTPKPTAATAIRVTNPQRNHDRHRAGAEMREGKETDGDRPGAERFQSALDPEEP